MTVTKEQKKHILLKFYKNKEWTIDSKGKLLWFSKKTDKPSEEKFKELADVLKLQKLKEQKLEELRAVYDKSKTIVIQNGKTIVIKHDTPERKHFINNLPKLPNWNEISFFGKYEHFNLKYWQEVEDKEIYSFTADSIIWSEVFSDLFMDNKILIFVKHKKLYDLKKNQILKANSLEEIKAISFEGFSDGIVIKIKEQAEKILKKFKPSPLSITKKDNIKKKITEAIKNLQGKDGEIHLIKRLEE